MPFDHRGPPMGYPPFRMPPPGPRGPPGPPVSVGPGGPEPVPMQVNLEVDIHVVSI